MLDKTVDRSTFDSFIIRPENLEMLYFVLNYTAMSFAQTTNVEVKADQWAEFSDHYKRMAATGKYPSAMTWVMEYSNSENKSLI